MIYDSVLTEILDGFQGCAEVYSELHQTSKIFFKETVFEKNSICWQNSPGFFRSAMKFRLKSYLFHAGIFHELHFDLFRIGSLLHLIFLLQND